MIASVIGAEFSGIAHLEGTAIKAIVSGNADHAALDALEALFLRTHSEAKRLGATELTLDIRELEIMSTSCMRSMVSWLGEVQDLPDHSRYAITVVASSKRNWQKRCLHTLRTVAPDLIIREQ